MSYQPIDNPPEYNQQSSIFKNPADGSNSTSHGSSSQQARTFDNIPDDFKYDVNVSGCDISIRHSFIKKVYTLLFLQLLLTTGIAALICKNETIKNFSLENPWLLFVSFIGSIGSMLFAFHQSRHYPYNLILLTIFTIFESYSIGVVTSLYDTQIVLEAMIITLVIFVGLSLFAFQTKYDFTSWIGVLNGVLFALIGIGFIWMFIQPSTISELVYAGIGATVFSAYIIIDTQLILRKYNVEEEVPAAIGLYLDIINLFLEILRILAATRDD
ncbi:hypothetical protein WICMUC_001445 [Wickerhamomyces mucosus]|uniref:Uncharacterized protein n=1 Tax=Wickerhamomyces mucosus TaxID=1378264 RepID=A0A9P8PU66_9ASCO|nr:hypothetical protein WICMUC_001445 [Wickerhamomyces mucosus]